MNTTSIEIPPLGCVYFLQSPRARHLRITIRQDKSIRVTMPRRGNLYQAKEFLLSKTAWIQKHLRKIDQNANLHEIPDLNSIDLEKAQSLPVQSSQLLCPKV
jgi:predicted metal-dependent hydrolase